MISNKYSEHVNINTYSLNTDHYSVPNATGVPNVKTVPKVPKVTKLFCWTYWKKMQMLNMGWTRYTQQHSNKEVSK